MNIPYLRNNLRILLTNDIGKELKYVINKHKLYSIALISIAIALMLVSIVGAAPFAYISTGSTVSVIDTATNKVIANVLVGESPYGFAVTPDGAKVCVSEQWQLQC
jgi:YVTN family beta-propeller protein